MEPIFEQRLDDTVMDSALNSWYNYGSTFLSAAKIAHSAYNAWQGPSTTFLPINDYVPALMNGEVNKEKVAAAAIITGLATIPFRSARRAAAIPPS